jgi:hypothetical protein
MRAYHSDITVEEFIVRHAEPYDLATDNCFQEPFDQTSRLGRTAPFTALDHPIIAR